MKPACSRIRSNSGGSEPSGRIGSDCGQPPPIESFNGPSSIICTNSSTTKFSSSVVTTSSTPSRTRSSVGPSINNAPASAARQQHERNQDVGRRRDRPGADRDRGERAHVELPLRADVVELGAERDRGRKAGEDQRRGARQRLGQREYGAGRALRHQAEGVEQRRARDGERDRGERQRGRDRADLRAEPQRERRTHARLEADHAAFA